MRLSRVFAALRRAWTRQIQRLFAPRTERQKVGQWAEDRALAHLRAAGLILVDRNLRCARGEIDLIVRDRASVVFVEVRYRAENQFGGAVASIDRRKQRRLLHCAQTYLRRHPVRRGQGHRFDVVVLEGPRDAVKITWIQAAFSA